MLGEFACMAELAKTVPSLVPMPRAAGKCLGAGEGAFFMCDYLEIDHRPANPVQLGKKIAELHRSSVSPTGKFGFHLTPYDGKLPLRAEWDSSWTSFFTKLLKGVHQLDAQVNGSWPELDDAMQLTLQTVVSINPLYILLLTYGRWILGGGLSLSHVTAAIHSLSFPSDLYIHIYGKADSDSPRFLACSTASSRMAGP